MSTNLKQLIPASIPPLPEASCGCDELTGVRNLIPVDIALERGLSLAHAVNEVEQVALHEATGRVLAVRLCAHTPLPPFDNSAMDGYALRFDDLKGDGPWALQVSGRVAAGEDAAKAGTLPPLCAFRIFTGAGIPAGADTIIMQEHVRREGDMITLVDRPRRGNNIRLAGEDAAQGSTLLEGGVIIGSREIGAIASIGLTHVSVRRKIRIALFCTGSELRQPGEELASGQIYNSNRYMMLAAMQTPYIEVQDFGAVADNPDRLRKTLIKAAKGADILITTGGVSVGDEDHMVEQLQAAGGAIEAMKIAMKPGKPLAIGTLDDTIYIGLPGNPVAAFTTWKVIGAKIAETRAGVKAAPVQSFTVVTGSPIRRRAGRQEYRPARISGKSKLGHPTVELLDHSFSAKIALICKADGFAIIPAEASDIPKATQLQFVTL
jgi:molybdopterin molybdotransferase